MIVDPDKVHQYFQNYDAADRACFRKLGRTTAYLTLMRDHVKNGFMGGSFAFISSHPKAMEPTRVQFLDMLSAWVMTPSLVSIDKVVVDTHTVRFMTYDYSRYALKGLKMDAIFVDHVGPIAAEFVQFLKQTGILYGYE